MRKYVIVYRSRPNIRTSDVFLTGMRGDVPLFGSLTDAWVYSEDEAIDMSHRFPVAKTTHLTATVTELFEKPTQVHRSINPSGDLG